MTVTPHHQLEFHINVLYVMIYKIRRRCVGQESGRTWRQDACFGAISCCTQSPPPFTLSQEVVDILSLHFFKFPLNLQAKLFWSLTPLLYAKFLAELNMSMLLLNSADVFFPILF